MSQLHGAMKYEMLLVTYKGCIAHFFLCHSPPTTKLLLFLVTSLTCISVFVLMYWVYSPVPTTSSVTTSTGTLAPCSVRHLVFGLLLHLNSISITRLSILSINTVNF